MPAINWATSPGKTLSVRKMSTLDTRSPAISRALGRARSGARRADRSYFSAETVTPARLMRELIESSGNPATIGLTAVRVSPLYSQSAA